MQTTTNIGLKTYEANDPTDWLSEFNYNMNKIDTAVGDQNDQIELIEETAGTAVTTANTASATATEALTTAEGKTSINDNVASATTTYSSNKINDLIEGIEPGTEIDDSVTSTTKTWSSSKINTEVSSKASINDTTAGSNTTYSSNKINNLTQNVNTASISNPDTSKFDIYYVDYYVNNKVATISGNIKLNSNYTFTPGENIVSNLPFNFKGINGNYGFCVVQGLSGDSYRKLLVVTANNNSIRINLLGTQPSELSNRSIFFSLTSVIE